MCHKVRYCIGLSTDARNLDAGLTWLWQHFLQFDFDARPNRLLVFFEKTTS